ncbi:hypothetical protein [Hyphomicrobium sp.]|uniref:hypothetical protein n=1 Tax=Hyphomicrobium sp. TaxID=82 RepID=UPI00132A9BBF|nr:hypothetical protein [Hyphomicrobium sp.]KAB2943495.1 MAG: hypothetical protein F9K20_02075 [Hyphomicrobium sp.]
MFKAIIVGAATLAFGAAGLSSADAEAPAPRAQSSTSAVDGASDAADKTSDRTPGDATPDRTRGATWSGATGTEAARTSEGTSDRTPRNQATTTDVAPAGRKSHFTEGQARAHLAH